MKAGGDILPMTPVGGGRSLAECEARVREARRLFQRTLASWASDLLMLRQRGLRRPCWSEPLTRRKAA